MSEYVGLSRGKVHETTEYSEYYCGGCGYPVTDHDSYCRECGGALHEGMDKSRWHDLLGTPERAARTLAGFCADCHGRCIDCCVPDWITNGRKALLEWLKDGEYEYDGNFCKQCGTKVIK